MKLTAVTNFSWAHRGVEIEHFEVGQEIETDDPDLIEVSTSENWAQIEGQKAKKAAPENKAKKAAPENK